MEWLTAISGTFVTSRHWSTWGLLLSLLSLLIATKVLAVVTPIVNGAVVSSWAPISIDDEPLLPFLVFSPDVSTVPNCKTKLMVASVPRSKASTTTSFFLLLSSFSLNSLRCSLLGDTGGCGPCSGDSCSPLPLVPPPDNLITDGVDVLKAFRWRSTKTGRNADRRAISF